MKGLTKELDMALKELGVYSSNLVMDASISVLKRRYVIDLIKLDDIMAEKHDYNVKEHGSLSDFITSKIGEKKCELIRNAL